MKQILFLLCFLIGTACVTQAQTAFSQTATHSNGALADTRVDTMTYTLAKSYKQLSIQPVVTKATGTMAGWAVLDYSVNGTNWKVGTDSLTLADQTTNTTVWDKQTSARFFRVRVGGATTVTGTATAKISAAP